MKKSIVSYCLFILMAFASCSEQLDPKPFEYTRLFTGKSSKTWAMTLIEETLNGEVVDRFSVPCTADDEYIFYNSTDRLYVVKTGFQKCATDEANEITDSWSFNNATATLTITIPIFYELPLPFIVNEADEDEFELEIYFDEEGTASYKIYFEAIDEE